MKLRTKIILFTTPIWILSIIVFQLISSHYINYETSKNIAGELNNVRAMVSNDVKNIVDSASVDLQMCGTLPIFKEYIDYDFYDLRTEANLQKTYIEKIFNKILSDRHAYLRLAFLKGDGTVVVSTDSPSHRKLLQEDEDITVGNLKRYNATNILISNVYYNKLFGEQSIRFVYKQDHESYRNSLIILDVSLASLFDYFNHLKLFLDSGICITDSRGKIIFHTEKLEPASISDFSRSGYLKSDAMEIPVVAWQLSLFTSHEKAFALTNTIKKNCYVIVIFVVFIILFFSVYLSNYLSRPASKIISLINASTSKKNIKFTPELLKSGYEFECIAKALDELIEKVANEAKLASLAKLSAQAAHDIRSPLAALRAALKYLPEIPEQERILIRNATRRITDISNNLLVKYKIKENSDTEAGEQEGLKPELVSSLLEYLISEKRVQLMEKSIDLILKIEDNTHTCFVNLEAEKFKRIISNLINNAVEAIETKGIVQVVISKQDDNLLIKVIDNGKGIPDDILLKIRQEIVVSTKKEGSGIGISSTIQSVKDWGGNYDIQSKIGEGTTFNVSLPITEEPNWFQSTIALLPSTHIVVLDDDESIHNVWQRHFSDYIANKSAILHNFYKPSDFIEYCKATPTCPTEAKSEGGPVSPEPCEGGSHAKAGKSSRSEHDLFLVDYELINSDTTGLDLIEELDLKNQAILVTSRYEEKDLRERATNLGVKIIPKNFAPYIPIGVKVEIVDEKRPELILIDDDKIITETWEMQASFVNKKIATFNRSEDFKKVMNRYDKSTPIYVDSDLKEKVPGETFAKFLYDQGFRTIYLATGYEKDRFGYMPWIKNVVPKDPPF